MNIRVTRKRKEKRQMHHGLMFLTNHSNGIFTILWMKELWKSNKRESKTKPRIALINTTRMEFRITIGEIASKITPIYLFFAESTFNSRHSVNNPTISIETRNLLNATTNHTHPFSNCRNWHYMITNIKLYLLVDVA